jgi:hypothetical protein
MPKSAPEVDRLRDRLQQRLALGILLDEQVISALATAAAVLREADDAVALDLEHAIRTHRIGILKQRAILGAAGIDV